MRRIKRKLLTTTSYPARLPLVGLLLAVSLLTGCRAMPDQWQSWLDDLVAGDATPVPVPPDDAGAPGLAPTPTLVPGLAPTDGLPAQPTAPAPDEIPAEGAPPVEETPPTQETASNPFTGTFAGTIQGHNDSSASLQLDLVQSGRQIQGTATLGEGLVVNAGGVCGSFPIPATTLTARDELDHVDGRHLLTTTTVQVSGIEIPVELEATLAPDGQTVTAQATIYPPSLCGREPSLSAELMRVQDGG